MQPERWQHIESLYHTALEQDVTQRSGYVRQACEGDGELEREVESLLAQIEGSDEFLETPALDAAARMVARDQALAGAGAGMVGTTISHYQIVEELGGGGMGVVYKALPAKDSRHLFAVGAAARGEVNRFDAGSGQFAPLLGGISVDFATYSPDGQWIAYVTYPDGVLWRSRTDRSERLQLTQTAPNSFVALPRWSPDGTQTRAMAAPPGKWRPPRERA